MKFATISALAAASCVGLAQSAVVLDGQNIPTEAGSEGLALLATQDTPTQFGDSTGTQQSLGGSELNQLFGSLDGNTLNLSITGNLEANFNKLWIFFDAVDGGENPLAGDNADGGFGEINAMSGLSFDPGFTADHALRFEVGGGFLGVRYADLIDNVGGDIFTAGGDGDLPLTNVGSNGVLLGWDNSNAVGVTGADASGAATATTGWEFAIDMATFFGQTPSSVGVTALISSSDGTFLSNQVLPGVNGAGNLGDPSDDTIGFVTIVPEPASLALVALGGVVALGRRRK